MAAERSIEFGGHAIKFPSKELQELEECNSIIGNKDLLWKELNDKGYLFVRGLHDRQEVLQARLAVLRHIKESGENKLQDGFSWTEGRLNHRCSLGCIPFMEGKNNVTHSEEIARVLEGPRPKKFFKELFGEDCMTFDYKWLRGMHHEGFTGAHVDMVYMGRGTKDLCTMWTPFGDVDVQMGTLAVCEGSNRLPGFQHFQKTYGNLDCEAANLNGTGWFTTDPFEITGKFGGQWKTADFKAGDVLIFNMRISKQMTCVFTSQVRRDRKGGMGSEGLFSLLRTGTNWTVHMSTTNISEYVRISCDTRWQPASEPADPRYVGGKVEQKPAYGVYGKDVREKKGVTMEELKEKWGFQ